MQIKIEGVAITNRSRSLSIQKDKTKQRSLSIDIEATANGGFYETGQDIQVLDGSDVLFGGIIKKITFSAASPQTGGDAPIWLKVYSDGYNTIPQRRTPAPNYSNTDAGTIVEDLVDTILTDEGITKGTIFSGATIESYVYAIKSCKDILDEMADISGYEWYIDDSKALQFLAVSTPNTTSETMTEGERDCISFQPFESLLPYRNKQFVVGADNPDGSPLIVSVEDSAEIAARASVEGNSGVYGNVFTDTTITTETDAEAVAREMLDRSMDKDKAKASSYERYTVGGIITVTYPKFNVTGSYFVAKEQITFVDHNFVYTYELEKRGTTNFSGKAKDNAVDFFNKLKATATKSTSSTSSSTGSNVYVQEDEPNNALDNSLWVETDDYSRYTSPDITLPHTALVTDGEGAHIVGGGTYTAIDITTSTAGSTDPNAELYQMVHNDDPLGGANIIINSATGDTFNGATTITVTPQQTAFMWGRKGKTDWTVRVI